MVESEKEKLVIIGNKPYFNLDLNPILDSFSRNIRCNMSIPNLNNGTKCDGWALCDHVYDNVITNPLSESGLIMRYEPNYDVEKIKEFYKNKPHTSEYSYFLSPRSMGVNKNICNSILEKFKCPHSFLKDPRMGYLALFWALQRDTEIYISNWSITDEKRVTYYVKEYQTLGGGFKTTTPYEVPGHDAKSEISILRWLHQNNYVDASLCLLRDELNPSFIDDELQPSEFIIDKLKQTV